MDFIPATVNVVKMIVIILTISSGKLGAKKTGRPQKILRQLFPALGCPRGGRLAAAGTGLFPAIRSKNRCLSLRKNVFDKWFNI
jgi:hypothetical protein